MRTDSSPWRITSVTNIAPLDRGLKHTGARGRRGRRGRVTNIAPLDRGLKLFFGPLVAEFVSFRVTNIAPLDRGLKQIAQIGVLPIIFRHKHCPA